jgi:uncharacterized protein (DUF3820 family)
MLAGQASGGHWPVTDQDDQRRAFEVGSDGRQAVGPGATSFDSTVLDFGHHAGRTIAELAATDPDYLRWLARHPSGFRYRAEIARVLDSAVPHAGDWSR